MDCDERIEKLRKEIETYREEADRLLSSRDEYLTVSAHQMKSPISTILFSVDTLLGDYAGRLNSKQLRIVESIKRVSGDLQNLIMDILELERFRSGSAPLEDVDITAVCLEAVEDLHGKIREKNISFSADIPRKSLIVSGNGTGLEHGVYNLLENAVKYSEPEGRVKFTLRYDEGEGTITGTVEDEGIGIPEEAQERIFEEFYRAPNARRFDRRGTGFGMSIVKQIFELCGGTVGLQSRENEGTTVTFSIPLKEARDREADTGAVERGAEDGERKRTGRRIVVVGGVAAGPKAASRARRLDPDARITVLEKDNFLAYAGCALPYYIAGRLRRQRELFKSFSEFENSTEFFRNVKGIEIKNLSLVTAIDREKKTIQYRDVLTDRVLEESYDVLVLATGSTPQLPPIEGRELKNILTLHGVTDSEHIKRLIAGGGAREIVIIGGGIIGVEAAEALASTGGRVTIVEREPEILPFLDEEMGALVRKHLELNGVRVAAGEEVRSFSGTERVEQVNLTGRAEPADLVIIAAGFRPNVELARSAGLKIGETGAIAVDEFLRTSDPSIYAAGDCTEIVHAVTGRPVYLPLGSIANRQGRVAGSNAAGREFRFGPVPGTIIIGVFGFHIAKTGLSEREALEGGFEPVSVYVPGYDRDGFMPGARLINTKMIADKKSHRLLGVQAVGMGEVGKRVDVASAVLAHGGLVEDAASLDMGYAPFSSQAMDNILVAAHVLENKLNGLITGISAQVVKNRMGGEHGCMCIDVRTSRDFEEERIPGSESIPLESLRRRIKEIPRNGGIVLVCETGARSYQAELVLRSYGYTDVSVLEGGLRMWPYGLDRD